MSDKISKESPDLIAKRKAELKRLIPEAFSEGRIDLNKLKQIIGEEIETSGERYSFSWAGKSQSIHLRDKCSKATLVPSKKESADFDNTNNVFIEGENLEVLKILQKAYEGGVKIIYIDPPYNTGRDFIYKDNYSDSLKNYLKYSGQTNVNGEKTTTNMETGGHYHSNWLTMMYPRLALARNLLSEDGVIFISIGQDELANLIIVCNEIFGEDNRIGIVTWMMKTGSNQGTHFSKNTEYILVYAKNISEVKPFRIPLEKEYTDRIYTQVAAEGERKGEKYREMGLFQPSLEERINQRYYIQCPDGTLVVPAGHTFPKITKEGEKITPESGEGCWRWTYERYLEEKAKGNISFKKTKTSPLVKSNGKKSEWNVYTKIWLNTRMEEGRIPIDLIDKFENRHSAQELKKLGIPFDFAKPSALILYLIKLVDKKKNDIILDFFAGSGTTAHAILAQNMEDEGVNRKFILVQLPEPTPQDSEAHKAGFKTIADICKERIRRVIKNFKEESKQQKLQKKDKQDLGFKVFKLSKSNCFVWDEGGVSDQKTLTKLIEDSAKGASKTEPDALLYEVMLREGFALDSSVSKIKQGKNEFYLVINGASKLFACFDEKVDDEGVKKLGLDKDDKLVVLDDALSDSQKVNLARKMRIETI